MFSVRIGKHTLGARVGKYKVGPGPVNRHWEPGLVNTNWGPGLVNTNWQSGLVNANWGQGSVNTNWEPEPGPGGKQRRAGGWEIQSPLVFTYFPIMNNPQKMKKFHRQVFIVDAIIKQ